MSMRLVFWGPQSPGDFMWLSGDQESSGDLWRSQCWVSVLPSASPVPDPQG